MPKGRVTRKNVVTARKVEVITLISRGVSTAEMAEMLGVTPGTVEQHVADAMVRTGTRNRAHLVAHAYERGLLVPAQKQAHPIAIRVLADRVRAIEWSRQVWRRRAVAMGWVL